MRKVVFALSVWLVTPTVLLAVWAEPTCDPAADPTTCNISAPINVSGTTQTKTGGLTLNGALITNSTITANGSITAAGTVTVNSTGSLTVNGNSTLGTSTSGTLTVNGTGSIFNSLAIFNNGMDVATKFNYTGAAANFAITADSINDSEVSNTLTASIFQGGGTTNAVDLDSSEVAGKLPSTSVTDVWVNTTGDSMTGNLATTGAFTVAPSTALRGITITPYSTQEALYISGATGQPLVSLNPTGGSSGQGLSISMTSGSGNGEDITVSGTASGKALNISSASASTAVNIASTGTATYSIYVTNTANSGYGVYATAITSGGIGMAGVGDTYGVAGTSPTGAGVYGKSNTGYSGYFDSSTNAGTGLYTELTSTTTTGNSKALRVVGKNGYGGYITVDGSSATGLYVENTNTTGTYSVGYFKANGASSSSGTTTALYAENTSTASSTTKYAIQAKATSPGGEGIYAVSDYGRAGHFESNVGGTGIYIDAVGGAYGVDINVSDFGTAIQTNGGTIDNDGAYLGGQFYAAGNAGNELYANALPDLVDTITMTTAAGMYQNGLVFDGSDVWAAGGAHNSSLGSVAVQRINAYNGNLSANYNPTTIPAAGWTPGAIVYAADRMYVFSASSINTDYLRMYLYSDSVSSGTLTTGLSVQSGTYDGEDIWLGTDNAIYTLVNRTTQTAVQTGLGSIEDIIFADGTIWALDNTNQSVYKINRSTGATSQTITVGNDPTDMEFDGTFLWVKNDTDQSLTRIAISDGSTETVDLSATLSGTGPIAFDGVQLWIVDDSTLYGYNIAQVSVEHSLILSTSNYNDAIFDGSYLWISNGTYVDKVSVGRGQGYSLPTYPRGIMLYGNDDQYHCIYFDSVGAIQDSTLLSNCQ